MTEVNKDTFVPYGASRRPNQYVTGIDVAVQDAVIP